MKLGNSNGNNKGKKYFIKSKASEEMISQESREKAEDISAWFAKYYSPLRGKLLTHNIYDTDIYHDTYLKMYELVLYTNRHISNYEAYFHRSYYTNYIQSKTDWRNNCAALLYTTDKTDASDIVSFEQEYTRIVDTVWEEARTILNPSEYEIVHSFMDWKEQQSFRNGGSMLEYSQLLGVKTHQLQRSLSKLKKKLNSDKTITDRIQYMYSLI